MAVEMVLNYILCFAVLLLVSPTTFANDELPPTTTQVRNGTREYRTIYTLAEPCDFSSRYRTMDGSCNNRNNPLLGKSFTPFKRFLPPDYSYFTTPRRKRPDSRVLSKTFFKANTQNSVERQLNDFFVLFGQFLLHDMALAETNHRNVTCCPSPTNATECMPTNEPPCHNFVRNVGVGGLSGKYDERQQLNRVTHHMDGSTVYGSTKAESDALREPGTGKMRVTNIGNNPLLPTERSTRSPSNCPHFKGGDQRVSAVITITSHHIFWVREHNYIVDGLHNLHPNWNGETLFQEARRIVIAEFQHIAYEEFLPLLIGRKYIEDYLLDFVPGDEYEIDFDASSSNAFTTAVFRHAHLMLDDVIFFDQNGRDPSRRDTTDICKPGVNSLSCDSAPTMTLTEALRSADRLFSCENSVDALIMGTIKKPAQIPNDLRAARTIRDLGNGSDLIAVDIERGRDHGLPPYTAWREFCQLDPFSFDADSSLHKRSILRELKRIYKTEDAVDLFIGGSLENKLDGAVVGPTFACILAEQMYDTKYGDRFWYRHGKHFTQDQLNEISRQKMSMILKRNTDISSVPVNPFVIPTGNTAFRNNDAPFNFKAWE